MDHRSPAASDPGEAGYQIDDLVVDVGQQRVTRAGVEIPLPHLSFALLLALARAAPNLMTFDELSAQVWPKLVITPETISQRVKLVRSALGDDVQSPRYIAGVRGRGYRMVALVRPLAERRRGEPAPAAAPEAAAAAAAPEAPAAAVPQEVPAATAAAPATVLRSPAPAAWPWGLAGLAALLLLAGVVAVSWYLFGRHAAGTTAGEVIVHPTRSIAVLPLVDVTPGDGNAYLGDGLAQELSARLGRISGMRVASSTSAASFQGKNTDVRTIARTLGVRHVLEGSVMRTGNQLRVTAQLIDADSGYNVWSQTYNRTWQDLVAIQDDVARSIIGTLKVVLSDERAQRSLEAPTSHVDAFDLYLAGLAKLQGPGRTTQLEEAGESFRQALAQDPKFALAYAGLCERYAIGYEISLDAALIPQAEQACGQALRLNDSLREVSAALARLYLVGGRNEQAATLYRQAVRDDPDNADGYMGLGEALEGEGTQHLAEAERAFRQGVEVEPTYWSAQTALGNFLFRQGRPAEALPVYRRVTELIPASPLAYNNLGAAYLNTAHFDEAAVAFEHSLAIDPTRSAYSNLGTVYYFLGRFPDAARMFARGTELAAQDHRVWGNLADALWQVSSTREAARDDYRRAISLADRGLQVNPKDAVSWMQLAYYCERAGDAQRVAASAQRAMALDPEDQYVRYYAALIALDQGDQAAALDALERAAALGYDPRLIRADPGFAALRGEPRFHRLTSAGDRLQRG